MSRTARLLCLLAAVTLGALAWVGARVDAAGPIARDDTVPGAADGGKLDPRFGPALEAAKSYRPRSFHFPTASAGAPAALAGDREVAPPVALTASDGTGLHLVALAADGVLVPPLAFTELRLTFENPRDRVMEGHFRIALPPGAAISRFAMKIGGAWQEAEVVERQRARQAYEDFLHRRQDPALLEQEAGNEFSARVFPIAPRERKELVVSYSHALPDPEQPYVLALHGLPEIGQLDVRVLLGERPAQGAAQSSLGGTVTDRRVVELHRRAWTPDRDFTVAQGLAGAGTALRHGNLAVVRVPAPLEAEPQEVGGLYVLVDSSASRALGWAAQVDRVAGLVAGLRDGAGPSTPLAVAAFDQEVVSILEGRAGDFTGAPLERLRRRGALGASDLQAALRWLAARLESSGGVYPRVLLVTDGVATAGDTEGRALKAAVRVLGRHGVERLDVLAVGGLRDDAALRQLLTGNLPHDGQLLDGTDPLPEIARRLTLACRSAVPVVVDGAEWSWPATLDGVQPGDVTLVYADLPADRPLRITVDGRELPLASEPVAAERPLLQRASAQARIERLLHLRETALAGDEDVRRALVREATELSVRHRVLSPFTALLVLETEADYARFGLDRRALADILTVGPGGLDVLARRGGDPPRIDVLTADKEVREEGPLRIGAAPAPRPVDDAITVTAEAPRAGPTVAAGAELAGAPATRDAMAQQESGDAVEGGVAGGVEGGTPGGVIGGVAGGVAGGVPASVPEPAAAAARTESYVPSSVAAAPPPRGTRPSPAPVQPVEVDAVEVDAAGGAAEETITIDEGRASRRGRRAERDGEDREEPKAPAGAAWSGRFAEVMDHLRAGRLTRARAVAESWNAEAPGDVLSLLALGESWEAAGEQRAAARAYGSLIDLFPSRADLRRLAGERLERLETGLELAVDTYRKAVEQRPDHPTGHRLLAWALLRAGRVEEAFAALERGLERRYPDGRFRGVEQVLAEDLGLLGAAWLRAEPAREEEILDRLAVHGARLAAEPSLRFVLSWETDANDVDLHVFDRHGGHAYYRDSALRSGGKLYADVTTGYGPECFAIPTRGASGAPYRLQAHYYARGPMGYGMGILQVVEHDGAGLLRVDPRPFVVMTDGATVELGTVGRVPIGK
jgi:tetratricopeptide (TPR) repeat protein